MATEAKEGKGWIPSYAAILTIHMLNFALLQIAMPFVPLYLMDLGETEASAIQWTGVMQASSAAVMVVANPIWGGLADKFGYRSMVMRSLASSIVVYGLMGVTTQAWQVFTLRIGQGLFGGGGAALTTMAVTVLPPSRLSMGMGMLQTAQFLGLSLGPVMGGVAAAAWGFRGAFWAAAALMVGNFLLSLLVLREPKPGAAVPRRRGGGEGPKLNFMQRLRLVAKMPPLWAPIAAILAYQTSYVISVTLLPLHIHALTGAAEDSSAAVGLVLTTTAIGTAVGGTVMGLLGSRFGANKVALACFFLTAVLLIPQTFVTNIPTLAALRLFMGFCAGGVLPALRTLLAQGAAGNEETASSMGAIYGLSQSAFSGGMALGALSASAVGSLWGLQSTYLVAGVLIAGTRAWWLTQMRNWKGMQAENV